MAETGSIEIKVKNLRSQRGYLAVSLFSKQKSSGFPGQSEEAVQTAYIQVPENGEEAQIKFESVPYGVYGLSIMHDEDGDKKLKTVLGIPREGFGFSNNPRIFLGPPSFEKVSFELRSETVRTEVRLVYFL